MILPYEVQSIVGKWSKIYFAPVKITNGHILQHLHEKKNILNYLL